jgi:hypothetical protein
MREVIGSTVRALCRQLLLAGLVGFSGAANALAIGADSSVVGVGATFVVPIRVSGAVSLESWQFDLAFDPSLLQANSVTEGPFLSVGGTKQTSFGEGVIDNTTGVVSLVTAGFVDLDPYPSGDGILAEVEFTALANGLSPLTLSDVFLSFVNSGFTISNGAVCVGGASLPDCEINGTAPEPATMALLAVAWLTFGWTKQGGGRQRRAASS